MKTYLDCWVAWPRRCFSQALAGEPELVESLPKPLGRRIVRLCRHLAGDVEGRFSVVLDGAILETPLLGEGVDQKAGWSELLREVADAAAGELLATDGQEMPGGEIRRDRRREPGLARLSACSSASAPGRFWCGTRCARCAGRGAARSACRRSSRRQLRSLLRCRELRRSLSSGPRTAARRRARGLAALRLREMPLGEILDLGPGDVVELDRHVADPVDLIVGDKIVARGEVVLVNGNFGLRVTEVAAPRKRLESIRCLF